MKKMYTISPIPSFEISSIEYRKPGKFQKKLLDLLVFNPPSARQHSQIQSEYIQNNLHMKNVRDTFFPHNTHNDNRPGDIRDTFFLSTRNNNNFRDTVIPVTTAYNRTSLQPLKKVRDTSFPIPTHISMVSGTPGTLGTPEITKFPHISTRPTILGIHIIEHVPASLSLLNILGTPGTPNFSRSPATLTPLIASGTPIIKPISNLLNILGTPGTQTIQKFPATLTPFAIAGTLGTPGTLEIPKQSKAAIKKFILFSASRFPLPSTQSPCSPAARTTCGAPRYSTGLTSSRPTCPSPRMLPRDTLYPKNCTLLLRKRSMANTYNVSRRYNNS